MSTWQKQSHGLFDFTSRNHLKSESHYHLSEPMQLIVEPGRDRIYFSTFEYDKTLRTDLNKLYVNMKTQELVFRQGKESPNISSKLWRYLIPPHAYTMNVGDVLRLGKLSLRVRSINIARGDNHAKSEGYSFKGNSAINGERQVDLLHDDTLECRICMDGPQPDNPFLVFCECSKSMPTHVNCVKKWLKAKCEVSHSTNTVFYNLKNIKCEVCETSYPLTVRIGGREHTLFSTEVEGDQNYAIFELFEKNSDEIKGISVLFLKQENMRFTIGRANENDVVFNDVSVSRTHAELIYSNGKLTVRDLNSKFGTHTLANKISLPSLGKEIHLQIEKFYFNFHVMRGKKCFCSVKHQYSYALNPRDPLDLLVQTFNRNDGNAVPVNANNVRLQYDNNEDNQNSIRISEIVNTPFNNMRSEVSVQNQQPPRQMPNIVEENLETNFREYINTPRVQNPIAMPRVEQRHEEEVKHDVHGNNFSFNVIAEQKSRIAEDRLVGKHQSMAQIDPMKMNTMNYNTGDRFINKMQKGGNNQNFFDDDDDDMFNNGSAMSLSRLQSDNAFRFN